VLRKYINSAKSLVPVVFNKPSGGVPFLATGLVLDPPNHVMMKPGKIYTTYFPLLIGGTGPITHTTVKGSYLSAIPDHPLRNISYLDKSTLTIDDIILLEEKPYYLTLKDTKHSWPHFTIQNLESLLFLVADLYKYLWTGVTPANKEGFNAPAPHHPSFIMIKKIAMMGAKFALPIYDHANDEGLVLKITYAFLNDIGSEWAEYFILSNSTTNITKFDGAVIRDLPTLDPRSLSTTLNRLGTPITPEEVLCAE
jgi:hypothetical protein